MLSLKIMTPSGIRSTCLTLSGAPSVIVGRSRSKVQAVPRSNLLCCFDSSITWTMGLDALHWAVLRSLARGVAFSLINETTH